MQEIRDAFEMDIFNLVVTIMDKEDINIIFKKSLHEFMNNILNERSSDFEISFKSKFGLDSQLKYKNYRLRLSIPRNQKNENNEKVIKELNEKFKNILKILEIQELLNKRDVVFSESGKDILKKNLEVKNNEIDFISKSVQDAIKETEDKLKRHFSEMDKLIKKIDELSEMDATGKIKEMTGQERRYFMEKLSAQLYYTSEEYIQSTFMAVLSEIQEELDVALLANDLQEQKIGGTTDRRMIAKGLSYESRIESSIMNKIKDTFEVKRKSCERMIKTLESNNMSLQGENRILNSTT